MDVLVDHSGYDLLNMGDVAMLQSCVRRLHTLLPSARLQVVCHDPAQVERYCPGALPVVMQVPGSAARRLPRRTRRAVEFGAKALDPVAGLTHRTHALNPVARAVQSADVVVASGGGYLTDRFFWHGAGVLATLSFAQRLGRPTAMFGQGLGPLDNRFLRHQATRVLKRLHVLGLREGVGAKLVLDRMGMGPDDDRIVLTGDDALAMVASASARPGGAAVGVNLRIASYTGVEVDSARAVVRQIADAARGADFVVLPVSRVPGEDDLTTTSAALSSCGVTFTGADVRSPQELVEEVGRCSVVVTTSYHAAVFALAQGLPTVCLTRSAYYDAKFAGLRSLYGPACTLVDLRGSGWQQALFTTTRDALDDRTGARADVHDRTRQLVFESEALYERFVRSL